MRFTELLPAYFDHHRTYNKPATLRSARISLGHLVRFFGDRELSTLSREDLEAYVRQRRQTVKDVSVNTDLRVLRAFLRFGVETGALERLPLRVRMLKVARKRELPVLGEAELERLLRHAHGRYYGIILIAGVTGLRSAEIVNLQWRDVYFGESRIAVTSKPDWSAKSHQERSVFVGQRVLTWLARHRAASAFNLPRDYVFSTRTGTTLMRRNLCRELRKVFVAAGLYTRGMPLLHWLRHSAASRMLGAGVDIETVRRILGHRSIVTTQLYLHTTDSRLKAASKVLDPGG
ncbi:MAG: tyrosine-type recombinase/integrase [Myxococcota bacterium]